MKICQKFTVPYFTLVTISKHNLDSLAETFKYLRLKRIPVLRAPFVPRGDGANFPQLGFTHQEMQEIIHPVLRSNHLAYVSFTPFFASPELIGEEWQKHGVTIGQLGCQAGRGFIGISSEGNVAPCVQLLDSSAEIGNVRQKPLAQLLNTSPVIAALSTRERLEGKCGRCRYRVTCGGCRALAFYRYNNIMAEDPTCFFEPQSAQERSPWEDLQNKNLLKFLDFIRLTSPWNRMFVQTDHTQPTTL
jgi:radical SAM protein with 4Fe4S-binding SPASM domain